MGALFSFLGGAAFRAVVGQVTAIWTARQEHKHEIERMRLQGELDASAAERNMKAIEQQAALGVKTIQVQADADMAKIDAQAFLAAQQAAFKPSGIYIVDLWNGCVRPAFASVVMFLWLKALYAQDWKTTDWDQNLMASVAGFYFADRQMRKFGK